MATWEQCVIHDGNAVAENGQKRQAEKITRSSRESSKMELRGRTIQLTFKIIPPLFFLLKINISTQKDSKQKQPKKKEGGGAKQRVEQSQRECKRHSLKQQTFLPETTGIRAKGPARPLYRPSFGISDDHAMDWKQL